jgi:DNA-binding NarL/FixJ family response regulator
MTPEASIRILVIESQPLTRIAIKTVVATAPDIEIVGEADNPVDGFRLFAELDPDVGILGLRFENACAIDDLDKYFTENAKAKIVVLADHAGDSEITRALKKGALGYICKDVSPEDLLTAIRTVGSGRRYLPAEIAGILGEHLGQEELTATEVKVLGMIVGGMSNKEIAFALDVSENTIKTHVQNIFGKIGVKDRTSAATTAIKRGLVRIDL